LLSSIAKCASTCLPAQSFTYDDSRLVPTQLTWANGAAVGDQGWSQGDIFGDGRDVFWTHNANGEHFATRINPDGTSQNWHWTGGQGVANLGSGLTDLFGDHRLVYWTSDNGNLYATRLNADGTLQNWTWPFNHSSAWGFGDIFGDGHPVMYGGDIKGNGTNFYALRAQPDGTSQPFHWTQSASLATTSYAFAGLLDLFGDGHKVILVQGALKTSGERNASYTLYGYRFNADGTQDKWTWVVPSSQGTFPPHGYGNLLGDGRDVYWATMQSAGWAVRLNSDGTITQKNFGAGPATGGQAVNLFGDGHKVFWKSSGTTYYAQRLNADGTSDNWTWTGQPAGTYASAFLNVFGDGRDVYWTADTAGNQSISRMYPDGSIQNATWAGNTVGTDGFQLGDFFGTGRSVYMAHSGTNFYATNLSAGETDALKAIDNGLGVQYAISTARLPTLLRPSDPRYVRDAAPTFPLVSVVPAMPVVTDVNSSNGLVGGLSTTSYSYGNLLAETGLDGRGLLGFQWVQTKDVSTGTVSRTYYRQDWPYLGLIDKSGKGTNEAGWSNLGLSLNTYVCSAFIATTAGQPCSPTTIAPNTRYMVYAGVNDQQAWDYTGTTASNGVFIALPRVRTTQTMDSYGNATQVKVDKLNPDGSATGFSTTTNSTYAPADTTKWFLGRLVRSSVTVTAP